MPEAKRVSMKISMGTVNIAAPDRNPTGSESAPSRYGGADAFVGHRRTQGFNAIGTSSIRVFQIIHSFVLVAAVTFPRAFGHCQQVGADRWVHLD